jgi:glucose-6-phosphate isomerase
MVELPEKTDPGVTLDWTGLRPEVVGTEHGLDGTAIAGMRDEALRVWSDMQVRQGRGADFLGFLDLPGTMLAEVPRMQATADRLAALGDRHMVLGIGGSYLGAAALVQALGHPWRQELDREARGGRPRLLFEGNNLDPRSLDGLLALMPMTRPANIAEDVTVNVISKSGTTLETAVAYRMVRERMRAVYGDDASSRIVATTDPASGLLRAQVEAEGLESWVIPPDVGGRYSVFSAVGLLPAAIAGIDVRALLEGAQSVATYSPVDPLDHPAVLHAVLQVLSRRAGRHLSVLSCWGRALEGIGGWVDQLVSESLGKEGGGRVPLTMVNTRDLHARGQQIQEGAPNVVVSHIRVAHWTPDPVVPVAPPDRDALDYVAGCSLGEMLDMARRGTSQAWHAAGRPSMTWTLPTLDAFHLGQFLYTCELSTVLEGWLEGINPLDQPGVEAYKNYMFGLLGRPDKAEWAARVEAASGIPSHWVALPGR